MSLEADFYKRSRPDFRAMERYGFRKHESLYTYEKVFFDGQFRAELKVTDDGHVSGRVIDQETEEEYLPIRVRDQIGGFVGTVREAYLELLQEIRDACFVPMHFMFDQSNRMESWIYQAFGVVPEFPWERYPDCGAYKCKENGKWFALVLTVARGKLTGHAEEDEIVEIVNLKAAPDDIPALVENTGVFAAWHMNKKHWISVLLDGTVSDRDIETWIQDSHALASKGGGKKVTGTGAWMIPSNPKIYDVDAGFRAGKGVIEWHQHNDIKPGDEVYIYSSAPNSAILYRCEVVESDLKYHGMFKETKGYERSMRIRLIEKYPPDRYPLSFIKAHGGSVVRSARRMPQELHKYFTKK